MGNLNQCKFIGRLGKSPETRNLDSGTKVSNFTIAVTEVQKNKSTGEKKENTEWISIVCWQGLAEIAERYLNKGDQVFVSGRMRTRSWEKDGVTRYTTEIHADQLQMLSTKGSATTSNTTQQSATPSNESVDDSLPF